MLHPIQTSDRGEKFIKMVTERALEAKLTEAESCLAPRQRLQADLATLEWMLIAEKGGTLNLPEDARSTAEAQIARLRKIRESAAFKTEKSWVTECFVLPEAAEAADAAPAGPPSGIDYVANSSVNAFSRGNEAGSLDRAVAKACKDCPRR